MKVDSDHKQESPSPTVFDKDSQELAEKTGKTGKRSIEAIGMHEADSESAAIAIVEVTLSPLAPIVLADYGNIEVGAILPSIKSKHFTN